jgi:hypothetical protein
VGGQQTSFPRRGLKLRAQRVPARSVNVAAELVIER